MMLASFNKAQFRLIVVSTIEVEHASCHQLCFNTANKIKWLLCSHVRQHVRTAVRRLIRHVLKFKYLPSGFIINIEPYQHN